MFDPFTLALPRTAGVTIESDAASKFALEVISLEFDHYLIDITLFIHWLFVNSEQ